MERTNQCVGQFVWARTRNWRLNTMITWRGRHLLPIPGQNTTVNSSGQRRTPKYCAFPCVSLEHFQTIRSANEWPNNSQCHATAIIYRNRYTPVRYAGSCRWSSVIVKLPRTALPTLQTCLQLPQLTGRYKPTASPDYSIARAVARQACACRL